MVAKRDFVLEEPRSIFAEARAEYYTTYEMTAYIHKLTGGCPANPKALEGWIHKNLLDKSDTRTVLRRNLIEFYPDEVEVLNGLEDGELDAAIKGLAKKLENQSGTVFKRLPGTEQPVVEGRQVKSWLKEAVATMMPGQRLGGYKNTKGALVKQKVAENFFPEVVFVPDTLIPLWADTEGTHVPEIVNEMRPVHALVNGAPQHSLKISEVVYGVTLTFDLRILNRAMPELEPLWPRILMQAEELGLGADRSQGSGRAEIIGFEKV